MNRCHLASVMLICVLVVTSCATRGPASWESDARLPEVEEVEISSVPEIVLVAARQYVVKIEEILLECIRNVKVYYVSGADSSGRSSSVVLSEDGDVMQASAEMTKDALPPHVRDRMRAITEGNLVGVHRFVLYGYCARIGGKSGARLVDISTVRYVEANEGPAHCSCR